MSDYIEVPVSAAMALSANFRKSQVIILAWDPVHLLLHTTTYGMTAFDKESAAAAGEICGKALGGDLSQAKVFEDFHKDYDPAFFKEAIDILTLISRRQGATGPQLQQIEKMLKAMGKGTRQG